VSTAAKVAFGCYLVVALLAIAFGVRYVLRREFLPYQRAAVGSRWEELPSGLQVLLLATLRVSGGGFLATGLAVLILLAVPYRAGELWARWAIPVVGLAAALPAMRGAYLLRTRTPARPPWASVIAVVLLVLGALVSIAG
jgi:hypothetical protein